MGWSRLARALAVCACILAQCPLSAGEPSVASLERKARKLAAKGDYAGAYMAAEQAVARRPGDPALQALASAYQRLGLQAMQAFKSLKPAVDPVKPPRLPEATAGDLHQLEPPPTLQPLNVRRSFDLRENPRALIAKVASAYGIVAVFDSDYPASEPPQRLRIDNASWSEAIYALQLVANAFYVPLNSRLALFAKETAIKRGEVEPNVAVSIPFPETMSAQDLQDVANAIRQVFGLTKVAIDSNQRAMVLRDRLSRVRPAMEIARQLMNAPAEVYIDAELISVDRQSDLGRGLQLPTSFPIVDFGPKAGPFQAVSSPPSGYTTFGTFGGGSSNLGVGLSDAQILASLTSTSAKTLTRLSLRSVTGQPATMHIGDKYPIIQQSYILPQNSPSGTIAPPPSITFQDLGVVVKITPHVHDAASLTLEFDAEYTELTGNTSNGLPIISSSKFTMPIRMNFGQSVVIAGLVQDNISVSKSGIPLLTWIPWLSSETRTRDTSEILLVLSPSLLSLPPGEFPAHTVWTGTEVRALPLDFWNRVATRTPGLP
jgi:hypothetical protein